MMSCFVSMQHTLSLFGSHCVWTASLLTMQNMKTRYQLHGLHVVSSLGHPSAVSLLLQWVWQRLPQVKERRTKDLLISVIASALYYNNTLTVSLLQQQNQLPAFLTTWGKVSFLIAPTMHAKIRAWCSMLLLCIVCSCLNERNRSWLVSEQAGSGLVPRLPVKESVSATPEAAHLLLLAC